MNHSISSVADPAQVRPVSLSDQPQVPASALQAIFEQQTAAFLEQPMPSLESACARWTTSSNWCAATSRRSRRRWTRTSATAAKKKR
nr:hypothetical protein [Pseudomonas sp. BIGb0427]